MRIAPTTALQPYVAHYWTSDTVTTAIRERALPSGSMHLALRLDGRGVTLFDGDDDTRGHCLGHGVIAGVRDRCYLKDTSEPSRSVGAVLLPGACRALFGDGAGAFANRHVALTDVFGGAARTLHEMLAAESSAPRRIALLDQFLLRRLRPVRALHPPIAQALANLADGTAIARLAAASGSSHKRFIAQFRDAVGLAPKRYARVQRLQRALAIAPGIRWCDAAVDAGYSDQAHLSREFRALTGLTPLAWRAAPGASTHHLPAANFVQDRRPRRT